LIFRFGGLWCFFRQRMNRLAAALKSGAVRLSIGQPLAVCACDHGDGAVQIAEA
jgi:hypothetical protein